MDLSGGKRVDKHVMLAEAAAADPELTAGKWVNVTTVPVLYLAEPLYRAGGYRLALVLPMLGSVAAALAAYALAQRLGARGWLAFAVSNNVSSPLPQFRRERDDC